jgi:FMN-dependent NADH-azoreductase
VIFESLTLLIAGPVHEESISAVDKESGHDHVHAYAERRHAAQEPRDQPDGSRELRRDGKKCKYCWNGPAKPSDFQEPYLRAIFGFIGIADIDVVPVEGVAMSAIGPEKAVAAAMARPREILTQI